MTRPAREIALVAQLAQDGLGASEITHRLGIPRTTVREWLSRGRAAEAGRHTVDACPQTCAILQGLDPASYGYLLGLYLGDGHISRYPRGVFRLRISCDRQYPAIIEACTSAIERVVPNKAGLVIQGNKVDVSAYSKHWPCLFPQHGDGYKHERRIQLVRWQEAVAAQHPAQIVRGLIHSDGCRSLNRVKGYAYPRYSFKNRSADILEIFQRYCGALGVYPRFTGPGQLSVARRDEVATLDRMGGPKL